MQEDNYQDRKKLSRYSPVPIYLGCIAEKCMIN